MFNWLFPAKKPARTPSAAAGAARADTARGARDPEAQELDAEAAPSLKRREERTARRERLYSAVRDAMTRAGVLSASYKFKVLSMDARGRQYLVMVDLAAAETATPERLAQIEALIIEGANARYDITVKAVYWRANDQVTPAERGAATARTSRPTPLEPARAMPAARPEQPAAGKRSGSQYDPIQADEVAAFKSALAAGVARPAAAAAAAVGVDHAVSATPSTRSARQAEQSYTLLTGFEDTELPDPRLRSALSGSQYGDLN